MRIVFFIFFCLAFFHGYHKGPTYDHFFLQVHAKHFVARPFERGVVPSVSKLGNMESHVSVESRPRLAEGKLLIAFSESLEFLC